jgi:hypothetical protein
MVNRGSTAQAQIINANQTADGADDNVDDNNNNDDVEESAVLSVLKFGWNSIFSVENKDDKVEISDEHLDILIDRKRGKLIFPLIEFNLIYKS